MAEQGYYIGEDLKFKIAISANGFSQSTDNYDIDIYCGEQCLSFNQDDVIEDNGNFFLPVPTSNIITPGTLKMVIKAYVPDQDFEDGYRTEIAVKTFGNLRIV